MSSTGATTTAPAQAAPAAGNESDNTKWWTLVAVCLGTFMLLVDITIINVALPDIQQQLGASFSDLQWVIDAYALTLASLLLTTGSLADLYGRRKMYVVGLAVFTAASVLCGASTSPLMLILARGVQGIGGAIMFSVSLALLATSFHGRERGVAFGIWGAITGLAVAIGPLVGGALTSGLSWRYIFFVNLPIGALAILLTVTKVRESMQRGARRPDWAGFVVFTGALSTLVFALIRSSEVGWTSTLVISCFIGSAILLIVFVLVEMYGTNPMFDLSLFRNPTFVGGSLAAFSLSASLFALQLYIVLYLQDVLGYSAFGTGLRLLVLSAGILLTSTAAGRLTSHVPVRFLIGPGLLLVGVGLLLMRSIDAGSDWTALIPGLLLSGIGTGLVNPPLASTAVGVVEPARSGMASGINSTFRQVGIATGIATLGSLFASKVSDEVSRGFAGVPGGRQAADALSSAVENGAGSRVIAALPTQLRATAEQVSRESFVSGLRLIFLIGAIVALTGGVLGLALVRRKDFAAVQGAGPQAQPPADPASAGAGEPAAEVVDPGVAAAPTPQAQTPPPGSGTAGSDATRVVRVTTTGSNGTARVNGAAHDGVGQNGVGQNGADQNGFAQNGSSRDGFAGDGQGAGGVVSGVVEHSDGRPFPQVPITVLDAAGRQLGRTHTDDKGDFSLSVPPGRVVVLASAPGCPPEARQFLVAGRPVTCEFVLDGDGYLYGQVVGGSGAQVMLLNAVGEVVAVTEADHEEVYELFGLLSGTYTLTAVGPNTLPAAHRVEILPGEPSRVDLELLTDQDQSPTRG